MSSGRGLGEEAGAGHRGDTETTRVCVGDKTQSQTEAPFTGSKSVGRAEQARRAPRDGPGSGWSGRGGRGGGCDGGARMLRARHEAGHGRGASLGGVETGKRTRKGGRGPAPRSGPHCQAASPPARGAWSRAVGGLGRRREGGRPPAPSWAQCPPWLYAPGPVPEGALAGGGGRSGAFCALENGDRDSRTRGPRGPSGGCEPETLPREPLAVLS